MDSSVIAAAGLGFVLVALVLGFDTARRQFVYHHLFELAWRNGILVVIAGALTGVFWILLSAGALLMQSIGIDALKTLIGLPIFSITVTCAVFGLAAGLVLERAGMLKAFRRFWLSLNTWFLPLALGFALLWVAALPFTGVEPLFSTRSAASYLFWFSAITVTFANAAFQDGEKPPAYPVWLSRLLSWAWLAMPVLALLADWALWRRVAQHGWTPDRIWAAVVALLVTLYALGYALSFVRRGAWMRSIAATNIVSALLMVIVVVVLISPVADVRRLAVADQVARLQAGKVTLENFDWQFLRREGGPYGEAALKALASAQGTDEATRRLSQRATEVLRSEDCGRGCQSANRQDSAAATAALREQVLVMPQGRALEQSLIERLARPDADWDERSCLERPSHCAIWLVDLNRDGQEDAVLLREDRWSVDATLYGHESAGWRKQGKLVGGPEKIAQWAEAVNEKRVQMVPTPWPDVMVNGERLRVR